MLVELSSQSSSLLGSHVLWQEFLTGVESLDVLTLLQVDDGQNSGNVLSNNVDLWKRRTGEFLHLESGKLLLQLNELFL